MRVLCLDIGEKRIGVAVSDPLGITAQPVETIHRISLQKDLERIRDLAERYETNRIVCGMPLNLDGSPGIQAERTHSFAKKLLREGFDIQFQDERLTTSIARNVLIQADIRRNERKNYIDQLAAVSILQTFMDRGGWPEVKTKRLGGIYRMNENEEFPMDGSEEQQNIIELVDEDGEAVTFEHLLSLEYKGKVYICMVPTVPLDDVSDDELVIMRIETDKDGNDYYTTIEDEEELNAVFEEYLSIVEADEGE